MGRVTVIVAAGIATSVGALAWLLCKRLQGDKQVNKKGLSVKALDKLSPIILRNAEGMEVHLTPVGASIQRLIINGKDVVLGYEHPSTYATVGIFQLHGRSLHILQPADTDTVD
jgi:hypothetical protein